jgi:hypothetical protein
MPSSRSIRKNKKRQRPPSLIQQTYQRAKRSRLLRILLILAGTGILLAISGFGFAASQESRDAFCASCHTQPETSFYQRTIQGAPLDMASYHTTKAIHCIDCHSGVGVSGRLSAELLGAHNALAWYTHTAVQPAPLTRPIPDINCLKCHQSVTTQTTLNNHFHGFLSRWQAVDPNAAACVSCHNGHLLGSRVENSFMNNSITNRVCETCHTALGGRD